MLARVAQARDPPGEPLGGVREPGSIGSAGASGAAGAAGGSMQAVAFEARLDARVELGLQSDSSLSDRQSFFRGQPQ
jgi:hypothetical protein